MVTTADIFRIADLCIEAGYFPELEDRVYMLFLVWDAANNAEIHRKQVSVVLPTPCRCWLVKGKTRYLLGYSDSLPADLRSGVSPPYA